LLLEMELLTGQVAHVPDSVTKLPKVITLPIDVDRAWLLERSKSVYTFDSTFGFEALLHGVKVTVFRTPFYSGWGLTEDRGPVRPRPRTSTLDELVAATLIVAPNYWDPVRQCPTTVKDTLAHLALQKGIFLENRGRFLCVGFSLWKRVILRSYLTSKGNEVLFLRDAKQLGKITKTENTKLVHWASRPHDEVAQWAKERSLPLWRLEDGFLRSVGLGSDWSAPGSLVFDSEGIYYDPREPSRLETLLSTTEFCDEELAEAEALITQIVTLRISKYNTQSDREFVPRNPRGKKVVFVPGQVADDASVRFGASQIGSVSRLLETVRKLCPDAYILYKPHPDVLSGNRRGHVNEGLGTWFDELVLDVSIARCLDHVSEVHTMSSLVGFEALLRDIPVTCHGQPFYAGWGLTQDRAPIARRQRKLTLPMLVSGTLMRYPRYFHFLSGNFCSAAQMADFLAASQRTGQLPRKQPKLLRRLRSLIELTKAIKHAG
jgi:capsular polysaccharide export protein